MKFKYFSCCKESRSRILSSRDTSHPGNNGGLSHSLFEKLFPRIYLIDFIPFDLMPVYKNKFFLDQKYSKEGLSIRQIAELTFSSKETIREALIKFGIPLREKGHHHGHPAQIKYGSRLVHGREIIHKGEAKIIEKIRDMSDEGLSLRAIVKKLDLAAIKTKEGSKKWHPEMVRRIIIN